MDRIARELAEIELLGELLAQLAVQVAQVTARRDAAVRRLRDEVQLTRRPAPAPPPAGPGPPPRPANVYDIESLRAEMRAQIRQAARVPPPRPAAKPKLVHSEDYSSVGWEGEDPY